MVRETFNEPFKSYKRKTTSRFENMLTLSGLSTKGNVEYSTFDPGYWFNQGGHGTHLPFYAYLAELLTQPAKPGAKTPNVLPSVIFRRQLALTPITVLWQPLALHHDRSPMRQLASGISQSNF